MIAKSIRLRFQIWLAVLLVAILGGFGFSAFQLFRSAELDRIDAQLDRRVGALSGDLRGGPPGGPGGRRGFGGPWERGGPPPPGAGGGMKRGPRGEGFPGPPPDFRPDDDFRGPPDGPLREVRLSARTQNLFDEAETNGFYYVIWNRAGTVWKQATNAPAALARPAQAGRDTGVQIGTRAGMREAWRHTELGDCILVGRSIADYHLANRRFAGVLVLAGAGILFVGLGGSWSLTTRALKPVRDISAAATEISGGNLAQRISVEETDSELGQLAKLLNATFGRLEAAFAQQKQFTADAAHELRTPLAVLISETQTALARPRSAEEYRETVEACLETAQRMRALTHSLLELARLDAGQELIEKAPFDLAAEARRCVALLGPLARERNVALVADLRPALATGDAARMAQVIVNLVSNAIYYNRENGEVRITTGMEGNGASLKVTDTGMGISPEALPHIFGRFYRADRTRTAAHGRSGLGLAISKAIVDAHGGSLTATSEEGKGSEFVLTLRAGEPTPAGGAA